MATVLTPDETLLGLLALQARHGYELLDCFREPDQLGRVWKLSTSQLYAVLKRLEQQALIIGREVQSENAPTRTEYHLSADGEARLQAWLHQDQPSASVRCVRVEFLSRLFIARHLNIPTQPIVQRQREACVHARNALLEEQQHAQPGIERLALDFQIMQMQAILDWIDRAELVRRDKSD